MRGVARSPILSISAPGIGPLEQKLDVSPFAFGRDPDCQLSFDLPWISRRHLIFTRENGGWSVRREGKNEVRLNGQVLAETARLTALDRLELGPMTMVFDAKSARAVELIEGTVSPATIELPVSVVLSERSGGSSGHLARLASAGGVLAAAEDPEQVSARTASILLETLRARSAILIEDGQLLGSAGEPRFRVSRFLLDRALESGVTIRVEDASAADLLGTRESIAAELVGAVIVAPLGPPSEGVLYADRPVSADSFSAADAEFATVLAHLAGAALAAARSKKEAHDARARATAEKTELARDIERRGQFGRLIGASAPMQKLAGQLAKVAPTNATVLITGETGSGKELVAREVHQRSLRAAGPFLALNCAALPEALIESELFGHKKGAFSGADADRRGVFEVAAGGTVFLDEIGELSAAAQAKVLRVLEAREISPLGGGLPVAVDVRLIAATHRDLEKEVASGRFRRDLYYRLDLFPLEIPALRERKEDIPALVAHFLANSTEARRKKLGPPAPAALAALAAHDYPGNVRELAHLIERAAILAEEREAIELAHLPEDLARGASLSARTATQDEIPENATFYEAVAAFERAYILRELDKDAWNRTQTAKRLAISRRAFMEKLRRYGIKED